MAIETNVKSDQITAQEAGTKVSVATHGGRLRYASAVVTTTGTTTTNGSTYRAVRLPSGAVPKLIDVLGIGSVDLPNVDVGAWHATNAAVLDDDSFATALDIDDTGSHPAWGHLGGHDMTKKMWQFTNATSDPGGDIDVMLSLDADAVTAGQVLVKVEYVID